MITTKQPHEITAEAILKVAKAFDDINRGPLTKRAIVILIAEAMPKYKRLSNDSIEAVLDAADKLKDLYIKKGFI